MRVTLTDENYYFGTKRWYLKLELGRKVKRFKTFMLGQDVKFCSRVLGCSYDDLLNHLNIKKIETDREKKKVGNFIFRELELNSKIIKELNPWSLSCE